MKATAARTTHASLPLSLLPFSPSAQTPLEGRILSLTIECGPQYPDVPPIVRFNSCVALDCVNGSGAVDLGRLQGLVWTRDSGIEQALVAIENSMKTAANRRMAQPPDGSMY